MNDLLNIFEKNNISATWAFVGHLFLDQCTCSDGIAHIEIPRMNNEQYRFDPCSNINIDPLYYGRDIVEQVMNSKIEHEIGYHSFSHVRFSECNREVANAEIEIGQKIAQRFGISFSSFVFPEGKIAHTDVLIKNGFKIYRGRNLERRSCRNNILINKLNSAINKIVSQPVDPLWANGIWEIPSSMFFCDQQLKLSVLPRAKIGLDRAIKDRRIFHIFLHPHNLLLYPSLTKDLDRFLSLVSKKSKNGEIEVKTMGGLAKMLNEARANR